MNICMQEDALHYWIWLSDFLQYESTFQTRLHGFVDHVHVSAKVLNIHELFGHMASSGETLGFKRKRYNSVPDFLRQCRSSI